MARNYWMPILLIASFVSVIQCLETLRKSDNTLQLSRGLNIHGHNIQGHNSTSLNRNATQFWSQALSQLMHLIAAGTPANFPAMAPTPIPVTPTPNPATPTESSDPDDWDLDDFDSCRDAMQSFIRIISTLRG